MQAVQPAGQPEEVPSLPTISAVIVSRNRLPELRRCIQALLASEGVAPLEIVVVDAGSRDGSAEIENEFPGVRMVRMPRNFGKTRARNNGVRSATGEHILFVDPSVEVSRETVRLLERTLEGHTEVAAMAPRVIDDKNSTVDSCYRLPTPEQLTAACLGDGAFPPVPATETPEAVWDGILLVRKNFIAGMNYFDEKRFFEHYAELDLFRQIRNAGKKLRLVSEATAARHLAPELKLDADSEALVVCDRVTGAAAYLGKSGGSTMSFQIKMLLRALGTFNLGLFTGLLSGRCIDGTQGGPLA